MRDLDVLIEVSRAVSLVAAARRRPRPSTPLLEEWGQRRDEARHGLLRHLDSDEYRDFTTRYHGVSLVARRGVKDGADSMPHPQQVRHVLPAEVWDHYGRVRAYETR